MTKPTVFVGMSGGVDSSLSALLLVEQGYNVVGIYMKNWSKDLPGMHCPWAEDLADAKRVAVKLSIDFKVFDFETEYKHYVVDYMLSEFQSGRTPNPDIMCNQEVKFKLFLKTSLDLGADFIATGHYAQTKSGQLLQAVDQNKDQTYFLYRVSSDALAHTLFPIGHLNKTAVKELSAAKGLHNAYKKESMGVCFVGDVSIKDFLKEYLPVSIGSVIDADTGATLGTHEGAIFYTVGQRHGLSLGCDLPLYVVDKDIAANIIYVSRNINHEHLWTTSLLLSDLILRSSIDQNLPLLVRLRHRAPLLPASFNPDTNTLMFDRPIRRPAPGQSAVFYQGDLCLGGGIIN